MIVLVLFNGKVINFSRKSSPEFIINVYWSICWFSILYYNSTYLYCLFYQYINLTTWSTHSSGRCLILQSACQYRIRTVRQNWDGRTMSVWTTSKSRWRLWENTGLNMAGFDRSSYPTHNSWSLIQKPSSFVCVKYQILSLLNPFFLIWLKQLKPQFSDKYSFLYNITSIFLVTLHSTFTPYNIFCYKRLLYF